MGNHPGSSPGDRTKKSIRLYRKEKLFTSFFYYLLSILSGYISWRASLSQAICSHLVPFFP